MKFLTYHLRRQVSRYRWRQIAAGFSKKSIAAKVSTSKTLSTRVLLTEYNQHVLERLELDGFAFHRPRDEVVCNALVDLARSAPCIDHYRPMMGSFYYEDRPDWAKFASIEKKALLNNEVVAAIVHDSELMDVAAAYLGAVPTVSSIDMWWSYASSVPVDSQHFHRDNTDWRFVKYFVYLSDVDDGGGPHTYIKGSHRTDGFSASRRWSECEVLSTFGDHSLLNVTGGRGSSFFEDTYGIHKGTPPLASDRLVFQIMYSLNPVETYAYDIKSCLTKDKYYETRLFY